MCLRQEACPPGALRVSPALAWLRPRVAVASRPAVPGLAPAPAVARPVPLARFSAAAVRRVQPAQQLAESEASAQPVPALRREEPVARDAARVPVAPRDAAEVRLLAAALPDAAVGVQREAQDAEAGRQPAVRDAEGRQPEVPGGPGVERPSAVVWVFRRDQVLLWPEP